MTCGCQLSGASWFPNDKVSDPRVRTRWPFATLSGSRRTPGNAATSTERMDVGLFRRGTGLFSAPLAGLRRRFHRFQRRPVTDNRAKLSQPVRVRLHELGVPKAQKAGPGRRNVSRRSGPSRVACNYACSKPWMQLSRPERSANGDASSPNLTERLTAEMPSITLSLMCDSSSHTMRYNKAGED